MKRVIRLFVISLLLGSVAHADDYAKEMRKAFQKAFHADFSKYQFFGTPVSNFGAGTMYPQEAASPDFDITTSGIFGDPKTWWVKQYDRDDDPELLGLLDRLLPPGDAGTVSFNLDTSKKFDLSIVLPGLFKILTASGNVNWTKKVKVQLSADKMTNRRINWSEFADDVDKNLIKPRVVQHLTSHDYIITTGDVTLTNYKALLVVDQNLSADAKAQLTNAWKQFGKDSKLDVSFSSAETGTFSITSTKPVVIAVFVGKPPAGAVRDNKEKPIESVPLGKKSVDQIAVQPSAVSTQ